MTDLVMPAEIETERLRLTQWRRDHFEPAYALYSDPVAACFIGGALERGVAWRAFAFMAGHWDLRGYGVYAVEDRAGTFVGEVGPHFPLGWPELELAWSVVPSAEGQGYAFEAARAVLKVLSAEGVERIISLVHPENSRSLALARRLGAVAEDTITFNNEPAIRFSHRLGAEGETFSSSRTASDENTAATTAA